MQVKLIVGSIDTWHTSTGLMYSVDWDEDIWFSYSITDMSKLCE